MAGRLAYAVYDVLTVTGLLLAVPFVPLVSLTRHGAGLAERFGVLPRAARRLRRPVWVHAASVGEVLAAEPLVRAVRQRCPGVQLCVSTATVTGRETARARLPVDATMLLPLDVRGLVDRVMGAVQPRCLVLVETELWPALIRAAARRGVPCVLVSGRVSVRAAARYAWIAALTRAVLSRIDAFAMQTEGDAQRIVALGAPAERVQVTGSLKLARRGAAVPAAAPATRGGRPMLIAASTHPGEERLVLDACARLWDAYPDLLLLVAPRRPERFDEVARLLEDLRIPYERRTRCQGLAQDGTRVVLLDTLGELPAWLPAARAVFVGGTIVPVGGHNVSEPALFGRPVAFGPHTEAVGAVADALLRGGAATRVGDAAELAAEWGRFLAHPEIAETMGSRGRSVIAAGAAVAERTFELVRRYLDPPLPPEIGERTQ
jgi:3-deoxy-D-manno-octulosonic-acid transferase